MKKATVWLHERGETSPSMLRIATARVAAPSVCFAVACILLAAAPTAPPCFRRWRRSSPLLLPRGGLGIPESFASSPEAPLLGELAGASPTERLDEGRPGRIAFAGLNLSVTPAACHLPYRGEALAFRKVFLPSPKFSSPPEAPLLGELSAKRTERLYGGKPDLFHAKRPLHFCSGLFSENQAG